MMRVKDIYISLENIKYIKYIEDYNGFPNNNFLEITYFFDDKCIYIPVFDKENFEEESERIMEVINNKNKEN